MTSTLSTLLNGSNAGALNALQTRGQGVEFIIERNAVSLVIDRNGSLLPAQTVMITGVAASSETGSESGTAAKADAMVLCKSDADIRRNDRFSWNATPTGRLNYRVQRVEPAFQGMKQVFVEELQ